MSLILLFSILYKGLTVILLIMTWKDFCPSGNTSVRMSKVCCYPFMQFSFVFGLKDD